MLGTLNCLLTFAPGVCCVVKSSGDRALIWISAPEKVGWGCSHCPWFFPVPTLLTGIDARAAFDRLATAKFRDHNCQVESQDRSTKSLVDSDLFERARVLIMRGYKPRDAVELALRDIALDCRDDPKQMAAARAAGETFLRKIREGLI